MTIAIPSLENNSTVILPSTTGQLTLNGMGQNPVNWLTNLQQFRSGYIKLKDSDDSHGILLRTDGLTSDYELLFQTPGHATDDYVIYSKKPGQELVDKILTNPTFSSLNLNVDTNTIKHSTTNTLGDLLIGNGTQFIRLARGTNGQLLTSTLTGVQWQTLGAGGGATSGGDFPVQHVGNTIVGAWNGITMTGGAGVWNNMLIDISSGATNTTIEDTTGRIGIAGTIPTTGNIMGFRTNTKYFSPLSDPYMWVRYSVNPADIFYNLRIGFVSDMTANYANVIHELTNLSGFLWHHTQGNGTVQVARNSGDATSSYATPTLSASNTSIHTIVLFYESANSRFGISLDNASPSYFTTDIPLSTTRLGCLIMIETRNSSSKVFNLFGAYCKTKVI